MCDLNGRRHPAIATITDTITPSHHQPRHYYRTTTPIGTGDITVRASDTEAIHRRLMNIYAS